MTRIRPTCLLALLVLVWSSTGERTTCDGFELSQRGGARQRLPTRSAHKRSNVPLSVSSSISADGLTSEGAFSSTPSSSALATTGHTLISFGLKYKVVLATAACAVWGTYWTSHLTLSAKAWQLRQNILAGSIIFTIGDIGAQLLTYMVATKRTTTTAAASSNTQHSTIFQLDQQRLIISTLLGVVWAGMANPAVYYRVEQLLPGNASVGRVLLKMAISCSILSTAGNYCTMFFRRWAQQLCSIWSMTVSNHYKTKDDASFWTILSTRFRTCVSSCNRDMKEVLLDDLKVWPLYDILLYSVIPPAVRPIANAIMASLWSMYMSIASAGGSTENKNTTADGATGSSNC